MKWGFYVAYLHENTELFAEIVTETANHLCVLEAMVEKDYYVTMLLRNMTNKLPYLVFKGGTSLSKCYKVIQRFSEDIDLTSDKELTQGQRSKLKKVICGVVGELGLSIDNLRETHSRRNFNRYDISYSPVVAVSELTSRILIETSVMSLGIPFHEMPVESMLVEVLKDRYTNIIEEFSLQPFEMKVQSIERTFIDKIFAICDYYMSAQTERHSRHLYDIAKIWENISPDGTFRDLIETVRIARRDVKNCPSAQIEVDVSTVLCEIIEKNVYQMDYEKLTRNLLAESFSYANAISKLREIADRNLF